MEAKDLLKLKKGSLIRTTAYTKDKPAFGTIICFHAPKFISVLMHQGMYKNKIVYLRGFDFDLTELVRANKEKA